MQPDDFGLNLIVAEERAQEGKPDDDDDEEDVRSPLVIDRQDFTTASAFDVKEPGRSFPIEGEGTLVDLLVIADSDQFDVYVAVDGKNIVSEDYSSLVDDSVELARIAAYQRTNDSNYVLNVSDVDFRSEIEAVITPREEITFLRQRADLDFT